MLNHKATIRSIALVALGLVCLETSARAGSDCEPGQGWSVLRQLASGKVSAQDLGTGNNDVDLCLLGPRSLAPWQIHWYRKSAKPEPTTPSKDGLKIAEICAPAFAASGRQLAKELCVALLAEEGVDEVGGTSTLALGKEIFACGFPLKQLPALASAASARAAEAQWDQEQHTFCGFGGCGCMRAPKASSKKRLVRRRAKFLREHKLDVLNALSYVGDAATIKWLQEVASKDADTKVRERAVKVLGVLRGAPAPAP